MQIPLQIHYHDLTATDSLEGEVRRRAAKLDEMFERIISIRVTLEQRQHARAGGYRFHVRLEVTIPGEDVIVSRDPGDDDAHNDMYVAIGDAFDAAKRQLQTRFDKMRNKVKTHEGRV